MSEQNTNGKYISPFIRKGQDREATIPATPFYSEAKIRYVPIGADEESIIQSQIRIAEKAGVPASIVRINAEKFAGTPEAKGNLLAWDVQDDLGHRLIVSVDNLCSLKPQFFDALYATIYGLNLTGNGKETEQEAEVKNSVPASGQSS